MWGEGCASGILHGIQPYFTRKDFGFGLVAVNLSLYFLFIRKYIDDLYNTISIERCFTLI